MKRAGLYRQAGAESWSVIGRKNADVSVYAESAIRPLAYGTDDLYFDMECDNRHVTAAWTQSGVAPRQQCDSDTVLWRGMRQ